jgi:RNA polymerase sigma-70 factor (ECF subfamily)
MGNTDGDPAPPDSQVWSEVLAGDRDALGVLYERHATAVFNHCFQRLLSRTDSEDLTIEVFLTALRAGDHVRPHAEGGMRPWLLGVANTLLRRHRSATARFYRLSLALPFGRDEPDIAELVAEADADRYHLTVLAAVLGGLSPGDQDIIQLCVLQGIPPAVVAGFTGRRAGTVRSQLSRALERARRQLNNLSLPAATIERSLK